MRALAVLLALASLCFPVQRKGKPPRPAEVEVVEIAAHRAEGLVHVDGRVRNAGERPIRKLNLLFDFAGASNEPITTKRMEMEGDLLDPGQETEIHVQLADPVRAVHFRIRSEDGGGRDLKTIKPGPYVIE